MGKIDRVKERVEKNVFFTIEEISKKAQLPKDDVEYLITKGHPESFKSKKTKKQGILYALKPE